MDKRNNHFHDNQIENILRLIKDKMNNLNEEIDKKELMNNFDTLIGKKINKEDIESIKKFIIFCYDKINKYWAENIEQKNFADKCVNQIKSLNQKVEKLEQRIARLENDKNEMINEINRLNINIANKTNNSEKEKAKQIKQLDNLHLDIFNLKQDNLLLGKRILEQENNFAEIQMKFEKTKTLQSYEILELQKKNKFLKEATDEQKQKNDILTKNNITLEKNNSSLKNEIFELQKKVTSLETNNNIIFKENKTKKNEIFELQKKVTSLETNNNIIVKENVALQKKFTELETNNNIIVKENVALQKKFTELEKNNNNEIRELKKNIQS